MHALWASDKLPGSDTLKVKLFNSLSQVGAAVFLLLTALVPSAYPCLALTTLTISMGLLGMATASALLNPPPSTLASSVGNFVGGFYKSATLVSLDFAPFLLGIVGIVDNAVWLGLPFAVHALGADQGDATTWQAVFVGGSRIICVWMIPVGVVLVGC